MADDPHRCGKRAPTAKTVRPKRHSAAGSSPVVEVAARHLSRWRGTGMAWNAEVKWTTPEDAENASNDKLPIAWRGQLQDGAAKSVHGSSQVRQHRKWVWSNAVAVLPCHRSSQDVAAALAMANLEGPLEPLLLLVCCEDLGKWPEVLRYAEASLRHPHGREAATDAMHRIMWRKPAMPAATRAMQLKIRRQSYTSLRSLAEGALGAWLEQAADKFLTALNHEGDGNGSE